MASIDAATLFSVKGLVAVVTGGGSGIGLMMAQALSANGAKVYIVGRRLEHLEKAASTAARKGSIIPMQGDVTDKKSLESMAERVKKEEGLLNLLVCNSGISGPSIEKLVGEEKMTLDQVQEYLWDVPMEDFTKVFNVNATGVFYSMLAFMKLLDAGNRAEGTHTPSQVIATSSIGGFIRNEPGGIAYASSKAAVTHMMKTCSTVLSPYDIRFNVIAPGIYPSEMTEDFGPFKGAIHPDEVGAMPRSLVPARRAGGPQDMAGTMLYLASAAGAYCNGLVVVTDGGRLGMSPATY